MIKRVGVFSDGKNTICQYTITKIKGLTPSIKNLSRRILTASAESDIDVVFKLVNVSNNCGLDLTALDSLVYSLTFTNSSSYWMHIYFHISKVF